MAAENSVLIHHQDGLCEYRIADVRLRLIGGSLDIEIKTDKNRDCPLGGLGAPRLYVESATVAARSIATLQYEKVVVPVGWDTDEASKDDNIFRIYLGAHFAMDNNVLSIERVGSDEFLIAWDADSVDLNYYDDKAQRNRIEVRATFRAAS